jgi:hypothetical protein
MHKMTSATCGERVEQSFSSYNIIARELRFYRAADLGVCNDRDIDIPQGAHPAPALSQIGLYDFYVRVESAQYSRVLGVLVQGHDPVTTSTLQPSNQVQAH